MLMQENKGILQLNYQGLYGTNWSFSIFIINNFFNKHWKRNFRNFCNNRCILFASTRLLPSISKIAQSIQSIKFNSVVVDLIYNELAAYDESKNNEYVDQVKDKNLIFNEIKFEKVGFSYLPKIIKYYLILIFE